MAVVNLQQMSKKELISHINALQPLANKKLKSVRDKGLEKYNQSFIKKYNILTNNKVNPNLVTKKGLFRKGGIKSYTKQQLIRRYEVMNEFVNNYYASAEYTEQHLEDMRTKWNLKSDKAVKQLFDLYREYGYDNFSDSDVLTSMSKIINDGDREANDGAEYLENVLQDIEDYFAGQGKTEEDYIKELQSRARILK